MFLLFGYVFYILFLLAYSLLIDFILEVRFWLFSWVFSWIFVLFCLLTCLFFIICLGLCFFFLAGGGGGGLCFCIYFFPFSPTMPCSLQALGSLGRSWALVSRVGALSLRYWSAGKVPDSGNINWHVLPEGIYLDITTQLQLSAGTSAAGHLTPSNQRDNNTVPTISRQAA